MTDISPGIALNILKKAGLAAARVCERNGKWLTNIILRKLREEGSPPVYLIYPPRND